MPFITIGNCSVCGIEVKADDRREAATIPILKRAAQAGRLICKSCGAKGLTPVDRDNPPDV
jgi:transcription elongation factor Elf1